MKLKYNQWFKIGQRTTVLVLISCIMSFCGLHEQDLEEERVYRNELSSKLYNTKSEDTLRLMLQQFLGENNDVATMLTYKQLGRNQRENARFTEAIASHQEGLELATKLKDTSEIIQALNNLGTDYRRIGALSEASDYHYQALNYTECFSGKNTREGMKNRVVSMNGIGNVSLTLGYFEEAEKYFREALESEIELESALGQAINLANIGSILEQREQYDSARMYYERSMEQNKIAKSDMGIGLCYIHLGNLYKRQKKYEEAKVEYTKAYHLMETISDRWHWLEACLSIAHIHLLSNNIANFKEYIDMAEETAKEIKSPEHLAKIYLFKHDYNLKYGNFAQALEDYKQSVIMHENVQGMQKSNQYLDLRVNFERERNERRVQGIEDRNRAEREKKQRTLYITWAFFLMGLSFTALLYYAYRQRTRSNKILKKIEQTRTDFFTNITHEFRTPLTVIQGFNTLLREKKNLSDKEKDIYRSAIDRQSNNLLNLVSQLLDIAKLKSGKDTPAWKRGDIISYLRMIAETFKLFANEKKVNLIFYSDVESIEMDFIPFYIDKIVCNLLSNAIRHCDAGDKIDFIVLNGSRPETIILRVTDTGEGISEEDLQHIFELFYQSENAKSISGSGIGLSFTQMMVEKMKGQIEVESKLGKGTTFTINLPTRNKNLRNVTPLQEQTEPFSLLQKQHTDTWTEDFEETIDAESDDNIVTNPVVLVIEDNKDVAMYIKSLISDKYRVIVARNGQEGLEMAEKHIPDVVITDLMMPIKDGSQFCCDMKQNVMLNHIPIIMLTAKSSDEDRIKGLKCGAEAFIRKPFHPEEMLVCIQNLLESRKILIEKYKNTWEANLSLSQTSKIVDDVNFKYLQTITDIIYSEMQNPELNTAYIAEKMAVSVSQLNRKINGITGNSTISYILQVKLGKAKKILQNTSNSVSEVADICGFYDANYFARVFKKEFGMSPSQFQKMSTNNTI